MTKLEKINKTKEFAQQRLYQESSGHDYEHTRRVWQNAVVIGSKEKNVDMFIVEMAALLHDVDDWKARKDVSDSKMVRKWLQDIEVAEKDIVHILTIIRDATYKGQQKRSFMKTKEGEVVQDADRLESIGAIGVVRSFLYGQNIGRKMYDPQIKPIQSMDFEKYQKISTGEIECTTVNHFYEKLLFVKDQMNTKTAQKLAAGRHKFLLSFLKQFIAEWEGKA